MPDVSDMRMQFRKRNSKRYWGSFAGALVLFSVIVSATIPTQAIIDNNGMPMPWSAIAIAGAIIIPVVHALLWYRTESKFIMRNIQETQE